MATPITGFLAVSGCADEDGVDESFATGVEESFVAGVAELPHATRETNRRQIMRIDTIFFISIFPFHFLLLIYSSKQIALNTSL